MQHHSYLIWPRYPPSHLTGADSSVLAWIYDATQCLWNSTQKRGWSGGRSGLAQLVASLLPLGWPSGRKPTESYLASRPLPIGGIEFYDPESYESYQKHKFGRRQIRRHQGVVIPSQKPRKTHSFCVVAMRRREKSQSQSKSSHPQGEIELATQGTVSQQAKKSGHWKRLGWWRSGRRMEMARGFPCNWSDLVKLLARNKEIHQSTYRHVVLCWGKYGRWGSPWNRHQLLDGNIQWEASILLEK